MILSTLWQRLGAALTRIVAAQRRDGTSSIPADALRAALASLPEPGRTVYVLHARDQVPLSGIGRRLNLLPGDLEQHLAEALSHLDRQIGTISPEGTVAPDSADR